MISACTLHIKTCWIQIGISSTISGSKSEYSFQSSNSSKAIPDVLRSSRQFHELDNLFSDPRHVEVDAQTTHRPLHWWRQCRASTDVLAASSAGRKPSRWCWRTPSGKVVIRSSSGSWSGAAATFLALSSRGIPPTGCGGGHCREIWPCTCREREGSGNDGGTQGKKNAMRRVGRTEGKQISYDMDRSERDCARRKILD